MADLKKLVPKGYKELKAQDDQRAACQADRKQYDEDHDRSAYIAFWEKLWNNDGLVFEGSRWHFELLELYISAKRYDDARRFCQMIKRSKPTYADNVDSYLARIEKLAAKDRK